jgi:hypothetical protein
LPRGKSDIYPHNSDRIGRFVPKSVFADLRSGFEGGGLLKTDSKSSDFHGNSTGERFEPDGRRFEPDSERFEPDSLHSSNLTEGKKLKGSAKHDREYP